MAEYSNEQLIQRWFQEVWNEGRLETIDELMAPDGVAHDVTGCGMDLRGPEEFKAATRAMRSAFQDIRIDVLETVSSGDKVALRANVSLTHTGPLGELKPTGVRVSTPLMCMVHFRNGKFTEGWNFWDLGTVLKAVAAPADRVALV
jgi:steroid delta-isomerase-like uncharacterized protein